MKEGFNLSVKEIHESKDQNQFIQCHLYSMDCLEVNIKTNLYLYSTGCLRGHN